MKQLYRVLKILLWCVIGVFLGASIYRCSGGHPAHSHVLYQAKQ